MFIVIPPILIQQHRIQSSLSSFLTCKFSDTENLVIIHNTFTYKGHQLNERWYLESTDGLNSKGKIQEVFKSETHRTMYKLLLLIPKN